MGRTSVRSPSPVVSAVQAAWGREHLLVVPTLPSSFSFSSWSSGTCSVQHLFHWSIAPAPSPGAFGSPRVFWKLLLLPLPATAQGSFPSSCNDPFAEELGHMGDRNRAGLALGVRGSKWGRNPSWGPGDTAADKCSVVCYSCDLGLLY